ncbi:MAG: hypothetical protein ABIA67_00780 [Candidatus Margulisiibacteriota bacterium]
MPPVKLSKRERNLAMVVLGFALFYLFYQFLLTPKLNENDKLKVEANNLRLELQVAKNKIMILEAVEKRVGVAPPGKMETIKDEQKALEALRVLAQTTSRSKLKLLSIKPMINDSDALKFELHCSGNYQQLYDFLEILHGLKILILIDSLNIIGGGGGVKKLDIKVALTARF